MTSWAEVAVTPEHAKLLDNAAITPAVVSALGIHSALEPGHAPSGLSGFSLPAIVFPWYSPTGIVEYQVRPDVPVEGDDGRPRKYLWRPGMTPVLGRVAEAKDAATVWLVEGTKQSLAAASHAPDGVEVYGIGGCRMWMHDGSPIRDLEVADGRDVVVILDADAASNRDVYDAGVNLGEALKAEGAASVSFARLPGGKTAGLDDILGGRASDKRAGYLKRLVAGAKPKPADSKPKPNTNRVTAVPQAAANRAVVTVNKDRFEVIGELTEAIRAKWDATELFDHGGVLARLVGHELKIVDRGSFLVLVQEAARTVAAVEKNGVIVYRDDWPDRNTIDAVLASADKFAPIDQVSRVPFVRPDGSVCQTSGYDEPTRTVLVLDGDLERIAVPDAPTAEQVEAARAQLLDDWLCDMPFPDDASRANALALVLTPIIRGLVPRVPLAVVDGLQMGSGKNLLADCLTAFATGEVAEPLPYTDDEEEQRKQITSAFRSGADLFVFDEAHRLEGAALARALTSIVYKDRILGVSTMAAFPNRVTWVSLGNNVSLHGDIARRVYRIQLQPTEDRPQDRPQSMFRHPNLLEWTQGHRAELMQAALTLVRAWFSGGRPTPERSSSFGSFEEWERVVGGVIALAGQPGFLDNQTEWRSDSDFETQYWTRHLVWLYEQFGATEFSSAEVRALAQQQPKDYPAPPKLDDPAEKGYPKRLGESYSRVRDRSYEGYRLRKSPRTTQGKTTLWRVERRDDGPGSTEGGPRDGGSGPGTGDGASGPGTGNRGVASDNGGFASGEAGGLPADTPHLTCDGGTEGEKGPPLPSHVTGNHFSPGDIYVLPNRGGAGRVPPVPRSLPAGNTPVVFDLETASADQLYSYGPGFARLAGYCGTDDVTLSTDIDALAHRVESASLVTGHNIVGFDLPVLERYHGLDMQALVDRGVVFDTLLAARHVDPPMAKETGVDAERKYDLDRLGRAYGLGEKNGDLKALAKEFGGYDQIPPDEPRYRDYLDADVRLSAALYARLAPGDAYLAREHRVAAIAARIGLNGFAVDTQLLAERVAEGERRKSAAVGELARDYGLPLEDDKGKPYKAPTSTKAGKQALTEAFERLGVSEPLRTDSGELMTKRDAMAVTAYQYGQLPGVARLCELVSTVVSERTIYATIEQARVDERVYPTVSMKQATGRWSTTNPGLTVVGKRGGRYVEREVFLADPGHVIVTVDLSQVDMRAVAALSQDRAYMDIFAPGQDAHTEIALAVFGDACKRDDAKAVGHGWNYGEGIDSLIRNTGVDASIVLQFDASMRARFPRLVEWRDEVRELAASGALLDNGFGRKMRPDPRRSWTQGPALMGQGCARDLMMDGLLRLPRETHPFLRAVVHDEVVMSVPADIADDVQRTVVAALSFEWGGMRIEAEPAGRYGKSWGEVYAK